MFAPSLCFASAFPLSFARTSLNLNQRPAQWHSLSHRSSNRCCATPPTDSESDAEHNRALPAGDSQPTRESGKDIAFVGAEKIGISFTCDASGCGERVTKSVKRRSYEKGTVLIQCPRCMKHHVIADNMGFYSQLTGGKKNVEEIAKAKGANFTRVTGDAFQLDKIYGDAVNAERREQKPETDDEEAKS